MSSIAVRMRQSNILDGTTDRCIGRALVWVQSGSCRLLSNGTRDASEHALVSVAIGFLTFAVPAVALGQEKKSSQEAKSFEKEITVTAKFNYLLFLPQGYDSSDKKWPLILFLHGAAESGSDLEKVKSHGLPKLLETKDDQGGSKETPAASPSSPSTPRPATTPGPRPTTTPSSSSGSSSRSARPRIRSDCNTLD